MRFDESSEGGTALQAAYLLLITVLVVYILMCKHSEAMRARDRYGGGSATQETEEGFDNTVTPLNFLLTDTSGNISTLNAGDMQNQITTQINASMTNSYNNAMRDSNIALQNQNNAMTNSMNALASTISTMTQKSVDATNAINALTPIVVRTDKTYELMSSKIQPVPGNTGNCLDSGSNWQRCNWDNAHRRFQFQPTPYGLNDWSTKD